MCADIASIAVSAEGASGPCPVDHPSRLATTTRSSPSSANRAMRMKCRSATRQARRHGRRGEGNRRAFVIRPEGTTQDITAAVFHSKDCWSVFAFQLGLRQHS